MQPHESFDDFGGLTEVPPVQETAAQTEANGAELQASHGDRSATVTSTGAYPAAQVGASRSMVSSTGAVPAVQTGSPASTSGRHATYQAPTKSDEPRPRTQGTGAHPAVSATAAIATPVPPPGQSGRVATLPKEEDDDGAAREPVVPRGTFASEVPERASDVDEREVVRATPEPAPQQQRDSSQGRAAVRPLTATSSQRIKSVRPAARPPYLASEILREDLTPTEPGRRNINIALHIAPALGAIAVLSSGIDHVATWGSLLTLALLFGLTRFELGYHALAVWVASIGGVAMALASGFRVAMGAGFDGPLLATATTLLPAALLFRTWYRAAYTARVLVTLALVLCVMWATRTSNSGLLALGFDWPSWVPALIWYLFAILCLLSLLAFMSDETTGGCDAWALGVSIWYGLFACLRFALETHGGTSIANFQTLGLLEPALAAPTAVALAQLFSRIFGTQRMK